MNINKDTFDLAALRAGIVADQEIEFENDVCASDVIQVLKTVMEYEDSVPDKNIKIRFKGFSTDALTEVFKFVLDSIPKIRNLSIIQNVMNLLKSYNSFDDAFFESDEMFFNSIEQFLDVKMDLRDSISETNKLIIECFLSLCSSMTKMNYTELDEYEEVPPFFKVVLCYTDLYAIFEMLSSFPKSVSIELKKYRNASMIVDNMIKNYKTAQTMIDMFLSKK